MREADLVWNRACGLSDESPVQLRAGDKALASLLRAHGMVMNGGVVHAFEVLSRDERLAAAAGYRYFGFDGLAALFERGIDFASFEYDIDSDDSPAAERLEHELNESYRAQVNNDAVLVGAFERHFAQHREAYAPVEPLAG